VSFREAGGREHAGERGESTPGALPVTGNQPISGEQDEAAERGEDATPPGATERMKLLIGCSDDEGSA